MKQGILLLSWSDCAPVLPRSFPFLQPRNRNHFPFIVSAALDSVKQEPLTARERRQLRKERRESKPAYNWKEEVEERFIQKTKKQYRYVYEELNLDNLAKLGPQWWVIRVSRIKGNECAERLARSLALHFPNIDFQVYTPSVQTKRKLKNGTISTKQKAIFPGCVFLKCVLNRELHDFIREYHGIGGFLGFTVGNKRRQIKRPRPVTEEDIRAIFKQAKEEQEKADKAFEEEQQREKAQEATVSVSPAKQGRRGKKALESALTGADDKLLVRGSTVQVVSGTFSGYSGILKKLDKKSGLATVGFTVFGKETLADLDPKEIVAEEKKTIVFGRIQYIYGHVSTF